MGSCTSSPASVDDGQSRSIEKQLRADEQVARYTRKLLLLGAGESGKSTVLKSMRILHNQPFTDGEMHHYRELIYSNLAGGLNDVIETIAEWDLTCDDENLPAFDLVGQVYEDLMRGSETAIPPDFKPAVRKVWKDPAVRSAWSRRRERCFGENLPYLIENLDRVLASNYRPTDQDICRCRAKTTGISETAFKVKQFTINIIDVGGQRSERRKWIRCFDNVQGLVFVVSLAGYDSCLIEDADANQMRESLMLFESISNSTYFKRAHLVLFLNKLDLFIEKLPTSPIRNYFEDYDGLDDDVEAGKRFFQRKLVRLYRDNQLGSDDLPFSTAATLNREVYSHFTTAVDISVMEFTMKAVTDMLTVQHLSSAGVL